MHSQINSFGPVEWKLGDVVMFNLGVLGGNHPELYSLLTRRCETEIVIVETIIKGNEPSRLLEVPWLE